MQSLMLSVTVLFNFLGTDATDTQAAYFLELLKANDLKDTNNVVAALWATLVSNALSID